MDELDTPPTVIHPSAIVDKTAILQSGIEIGPFCVIGPKVQIGHGTKLISHVIIVGSTTIGSRCTIYPTAVIGGDEQHSAPGRCTTRRVVIGDDCVVREGATINRSTENSGQPTRIGHRVLIFTGAHIAHDCQVGDDAIIVNHVDLGGHVEIGRGAIVAGQAGVAQRVRIGCLSFVSAGTKVSRDVLPFSMVKGHRAHTVGANKIGLRRKGWSNDMITKIEDVIQRATVEDVAGLRHLCIDPIIGREARSLLDFRSVASNGVCLGLYQPNLSTRLEKL